MIKLILFDLGGVLFTNGAKKFYRDISERYKLPYDEVADLLGEGEWGSKYREGHISREEFWKVVIDKLHLTESVEKLEAEWIGNYKLIEGTRDIIIELRKKYSVMYLSDNVRQRVEGIDAQYHFTQWFNSGVFSHEVGCRKPNPRVYEAALKKGGVSGNEVVFIDDKTKNLPAAQALGITPILFETPEKLRTDLKSLGIL